ncbi:MAG: Zn-ribbon containing protein [Candidatus Pacearchaeota archaeon]|nr:Zn-ribbon containing protein [Candidatus Pacearchaeota archaeon]
MPNRCVRCGKIYETASPEILTGCSNCGSHYFFFFKEGDVKLQAEMSKITRAEGEEILNDVQEIVGEGNDKPVILDLESIRIKKSGKFEIDLVSLFKRKPIIYKIEDGKYFIDLASTMQLSGKRSKKEKAMEKYENKIFNEQIKEGIDQKEESKDPDKELIDEICSDKEEKENPQDKED